MTDLLDDMRVAALKLKTEARPLVAFEVGTGAWQWLQENCPTPTSTHNATASIGHVEIRVVHSLRPNLCVPVFRDSDGEECWGEPIEVKP